VSAAPEEKSLAPRDPAFLKWRARFRGIVGEDPRLHQVFRFVERVASSKTTVLLLGESGTGKELIAEAIHRESNRVHKPFVKVNCAAFVESLLLSELFGHEKGAFTGALSQKAGRFEIAHGGTIFLDEIGDISSNTQVALLRVLQEGTFDRVGGSETMKVDVRIVCATNKNLEEMVKRGEFRLDLYYRLKGLVVELPPLRERRRDIPLLLAHFAGHYADGDSPRRFSREALHFLSAYSWAGNVRELENFVKSVLLFVEGPVVEMSHIQEFSEFFADGDVDLDLPELDGVEYVEAPTIVAALEVGKPGSVLASLSTNEDPEEALIEQIVAEGLSLTRLKKRLELECIKRALLETDGNITRAAELLQMKRPRLSQIINSTPELLNCKESLVG
jgi:transcriptional regulator with GAF, ATPase, and Fis domain